MTKREKICEKAKEFAYKRGTKSVKYTYDKGAPKPVYKKALKKYMNKKAKISQSDCGYFVNTCIRASGVSKSFKALAGRGEPFPKIPKNFDIIHTGKIKKGILKSGDVIRYKKKNGGQHTLLYLGDGLIAHAGRGHWFPKIVKSKPWNGRGVKKSTIEVIRVKEKK